MVLFQKCNLICCPLVIWIAFKSSNIGVAELLCADNSITGPLICLYFKRKNAGCPQVGVLPVQCSDTVDVNLQYYNKKTKNAVEEVEAPVNVIDLSKRESMLVISDVKRDSSSEEIRYSG